MIEPRERDWGGLADWTKVPDIAPTVPALLQHCRASCADQELMVVDEQRVTYGEVCEQSAKLARQLVSAGVGKGMRIGMLFPNTADFLVTWLAITRIGAVAVPISTLSTGPELRRIAQHAAFHLLITIDRYLHHNYIERIENAFGDLAAPEHRQVLRTAPYLREIWVWGDNVPAWASKVDLTRECDFDEELLASAESRVKSRDPVSIIYTSGSTADPKGVIHSHGNFLRQGARLAALYPYRDNDRIFSQMPFFWVGGLTLNIMPVMHTGATLLCSNKTGSELLDFCEKERMTYMVGWPHIARAMSEDPTFLKRDWSCMRGGRLYELLPGSSPPKNHFANTLGMTETCGSHHIPLPQIPPGLEGSLGIAMPGTERRIVDPDSGREVADGTPGILQVRGDAVLLGMVDRERADVFDADGWYGTGDLCSVREGHLFFHGRADDMIKSSGANVSPREVEAVLMTIPGVAQANVSGVADRERGSIVGAIIVPKPGVELDAEAIRTQAAKALSSYKVPRRIVFVPSAKLPMMSSGKVDRRALLRLLDEAHNGNA